MIQHVRPSGTPGAGRLQAFGRTARRLRMKKEYGRSDSGRRVWLALSEPPWRAPLSARVADEQVRPDRAAAGAPGARSACTSRPASGPGRRRGFRNDRRIRRVALRVASFSRLRQLFRRCTRARIRRRDVFASWASATASCNHCEHRRRPAHRCQGNREARTSAVASDLSRRSPPLDARGSPGGESAFVRFPSAGAWSSTSCDRASGAATGVAGTFALFITP